MESIVLNSVAGLEIGSGRGALQLLQILEKVRIGLSCVLCAVNNDGGAAGGAGYGGSHDNAVIFEA